MAMESPQRIVRITSLDFRKAFDLINHNVLLENFMQIGVRPAVVVGLHHIFITDHK